MNKKLIFIPLLCSVTCLTGCMRLLSSLTSNNVSHPSFSNEGDETTSDKFQSALLEDMDDAGLAYLVNNTHYESLVGSYKIGIESNEYISPVKGAMKDSQKTTTKRIASISYDRSKEVIAFENKQNTTYKGVTISENQEGSDSYTYKGHYQLENDVLVTTDDVVKSYEDTYIPNYIEKDYRLDYIIYNNIGAIANLINTYTSSTYKEYCTFYRNGKTYTVKYERVFEEETSQVKTKRTYEEKVQMVFESNKVTIKIDDTSSMTDTYLTTTTSHTKNDKRVYNYDTYGTASIEFKTPSKVNAVDLSGYEHVEQEENNMKRLAVISLLTLSISLTGCTGLLKSLLSSSGSNVKFEEKGEKMDRSSWMDSFNKSLKNSNFNTDDPIKSFQINATTKIKNTTEEKNRGNTYSEESTTTGNATYQYDANAYLYKYSSSSKSSETRKSPYGKTTESDSQSAGTFYQMNSKTLYTIDTVAKTYTTSTGDQTAEQVISYYAKNGLESVLVIFDLFVVLDTNEELDYYQNGEIFTIYLSTKDEKTDINASNDSSKVVGEKTTNGEMTLQLNLTSGKNSFKYSIQSEALSEYKEDDLNNGHKAGDTIKSNNLSTYVADIKFQSQNMSKLSLTGYTKLN